MLVCNVSTLPRVIGRLVATDAADTAVFFDKAFGVLTATELKDIAAFSYLMGTASGSLTATGAPDVALLAGTSATLGALAAVEQQDTAFIGPFTPLALAPIFWFKGDSLSGADNDPITTWTDSSGNGRHAIQSVSANRPLLRTAFVNGLNVTSYNLASSQWFNMASLVGVATSATMAYMVQAGADPPTGGPTGPVRIGNNAANQCHYPFSDGVIYNDDCSTVRKTVGNPTVSLTSWRCVTITSAVNSWQYYIDGTQIFTTASNTVGFTATPYIGSGSLSTPSVNSWTGLIGEVLCIPGAGATNRQTLEGNLMWKFATQANLPAGHPYKTAPP